MLVKMGSFEGKNKKSLKPPPRLAFFLLKSGYFLGSMLVLRGSKSNFMFQKQWSPPKVCSGKPAWLNEF